ANYRDLVRAQHQDFEGALERFTVEIQKRLWADLEKARGEFERLIHTELRLIRQRAPVQPPERRLRPELTAPQSRADAPAQFEFDYARFAERFRGTDEYVKRNQEVYLPYFQGRENVLDVGCGRGEFLEMM